jgi:hypothetical protein
MYVPFSSPHLWLYARVNADPFLFLPHTASCPLERDPQQLEDTRDAARRSAPCTAATAAATRTAVRAAVKAVAIHSPSTGRGANAARWG